MNPAGAERLPFLSPPAIFLPSGAGLPRPVGRVFVHSGFGRRLAAVV